MNTIHKHKLNFGETTLSLPIGSKILDIQIIEFIAYVWILFDKENESIFRDVTINSYYTGDDVPNGQEFIKTVKNDNLQFHFFKELF